MRIALVEPLPESAKITITYNGIEFFCADFAAGEIPRVEIQTPQESGRAKATLFMHGTEVQLGTASYYFDDIIGATMLIADAAELRKKKKAWRARTKLLKAISILKQLAPESNELAEAYCAMSLTYWSLRCRPENRAMRQTQSIGWYEKALAVWSRNGNVKALGVNLTNISVLYGRVDMLESSLQGAQEGLQIELENPTPIGSPGYDHRVAAWTHLAGAHLKLEQLDSAEAVIVNGLETLGAETPGCHYLWDIWARVHDARARFCAAKHTELRTTHTAATVMGWASR